MTSRSPVSCAELAPTGRCAAGAGVAAADDAVAAEVSAGEEEEAGEDTAEEATDDACDGTDLRGMSNLGDRRRLDA
ncbi:hypothetical protein RO07_25605 [Pandoraea pulmonicola]|uniref:Uncharacterized protein n=1 Tax=Pandoraea pulmonicola TaxID=93221 RepID=A0ABN4U7N6_PANPU|nr:hypothetical protein RO07_25605 [Pandoraea pulmonicola]